MMSEVGPRLSSNKPLNNEYYETRDLENSDSGGDIHTDSGTDRDGHDIVHGRADALVNNDIKRMPLWVSACFLFLVTTQHPIVHE